MVALLLALLSSGIAARADDCATCTPTALCAVHQKEEAAAVAEVTPKLKSKDPSDRRFAIAALVALDAKHPLCPSLESAKLVAAALDDEKVAVRLEAVKALERGMHPDVSVGALATALEETHKELAKIPFGKGDWGGGAPGAKEDPKVVERRKARDELVGLAQQIVKGLRELPDDRSVAALADLLPTLSRWNGELLSATADALLGLGARDGVTAVVQRLKSAPVNDTGGKYGGGPDTTGKTLRDLLAEAAPKKGTEPVPAWDEKEAPDWERWLAKNQKHFPAKLGRYGIEQLRKAKG
jgi:hypothetical protein